MRWSLADALIRVGCRDRIDQAHGVPDVQARERFRRQELAERAAAEIGREHAQIDPEVAVAHQLEAGPAGEAPEGVDDGALHHRGPERGAEAVEVIGERGALDPG